MSFYTALTGLNGSSADISATSNNIANVGTTGFKRSRVEFGDIFATSPLQNASSSIGSGTILKGIKQQFTQGNIAASLNALDLAISGQGFFALKPSLTSAQTVYTRNGSLNVNNDRYVVDSAGQYLLVYPVNDDGSVTAKDLQSAVPLQLPVIDRRIQRQLQFDGFALERRVALGRRAVGQVRGGKSSHTQQRVREDVARVRLAIVDRHVDLLRTFMHIKGEDLLVF